MNCRATDFPRSRKTDGNRGISLLKRKTEFSVFFRPNLLKLHSLLIFFLLKQKSIKNQVVLRHVFYIFFPPKSHFLPTPYQQYTQTSLPMLYMNTHNDFSFRKGLK